MAFNPYRKQYGTSGSNRKRPTRQSLATVSAMFDDEARDTCLGNVKERRDIFPSPSNASGYRVYEHQLVFYVDDGTMNMESTSTPKVMSVLSGYSDSVSLLLKNQGKLDQAKHLLERKIRVIGQPTGAIDVTSDIPHQEFAVQIRGERWFYSITEIPYNSVLMWKIPDPAELKVLDNGGPGELGHVLGAMPLVIVPVPPDHIAKELEIMNAIHLDSIEKYENILGADYEKAEDKKLIKSIHDNYILGGVMMLSHMLKNGMVIISDVAGDHNIAKPGMAAPDATDYCAGLLSLLGVLGTKNHSINSIKSDKNTQDTMLALRMNIIKSTMLNPKDRVHQLGYNPQTQKTRGVDDSTGYLHGQDVYRSVLEKQLSLWKQNPLNWDQLCKYRDERIVGISTNSVGKHDFGTYI